MPPRSRLIDEIIDRIAKEEGVNPALVRAVIKQESGYNTMATSEKDARGLMQVLPGTAREVGVDPEDLYDPEWGVRAGTRYLKKLQTTYGAKDDYEALQMYHTGIGNVRKGKIGPIGKRYPGEVLGRMDGGNGGNGGQRGVIQLGRRKRAAEQAPAAEAQSLYTYDPARIKQRYEQHIQERGALRDPARTSIFEPPAPPEPERAPGLPGEPPAPSSVATYRGKATTPEEARAMYQIHDPGDQFRYMTPNERLMRSIKRGAGKMLSGIGGAYEWFEYAADPRLEDSPRAATLRQKWEERRGLPPGSYKKIREQTRLGTAPRAMGEKYAKKFPMDPVVTQSIIDNPGLLATPEWWMEHGPQTMMTSALFFGAGPVGYVLAGRLGAVAAPVIMESLLEGGFVYSDMKNRGSSDQEAADAAAMTTLINLPITYLPAETIFGGRIAKGLVSRGLASMGAEATQEVAQEATSAVAMGDPIDPAQLATAGVLGGAMGGVMGVAASAAMPEEGAAPQSEEAMKSEVFEFLDSLVAGTGDFTARDLTYRPDIELLFRLYAEHRGPQGLAKIYEDTRVDERVRAAARKAAYSARPPQPGAAEGTPAEEAAPPPGTEEGVPVTEERPGITVEPVPEEEAIPEEELAPEEPEEEALAEEPEAEEEAAPEAAEDLHEIDVSELTPEQVGQFMEEAGDRVIERDGRLFSSVEDEIEVETRKQRIIVDAALAEEEEGVEEEPEERRKEAKPAPGFERRGEPPTDETGLSWDLTELSEPAYHSILNEFRQAFPDIPVYRDQGRFRVYKDQATKEARAHLEDAFEEAHRLETEEQAKYKEEEAADQQIKPERPKEPSTVPKRWTRKYVEGGRFMGDELAKANRVVSETSYDDSMFRTDLQAIRRVWTKKDGLRTTDVEQLARGLRAVMRRRAHISLRGLQQDQKYEKEASTAIRRGLAEALKKEEAAEEPPPRKAGYEQGMTWWVDEEGEPHFESRGVAEKKGYRGPFAGPEEARLAGKRKPMVIPVTELLSPDLRYRQKYREWILAGRPDPKPGPPKGWTGEQMDRLSKEVWAELQEEGLVPEEEPAPAVEEAVYWLDDQNRVRRETLEIAEERGPWRGPFDSPNDAILAAKEEPRAGNAPPVKLHKALVDWYGRLDPQEASYARNYARWLFNNRNFDEPQPKDMGRSAKDKWDLEDGPARSVRNNLIETIAKYGGDWGVSKVQDLLPEGKAKIVPTKEGVKVVPPTAPLRLGQRVTVQGRQGTIVEEHKDQPLVKFDRIEGATDPSEVRTIAVAANMIEGTEEVDLSFLDGLVNAGTAQTNRDAPATERIERATKGMEAASRLQAYWLPKLKDPSKKMRQRAARAVDYYGGKHAELKEIQSLRDRVPTPKEEEGKIALEIDYGAGVESADFTIVDASEAPQPPGHFGYKENSLNAELWRKGYADAVAGKAQPKAVKAPPGGHAAAYHRGYGAGWEETLRRKRKKEPPPKLAPGEKVPQTMLAAPQAVRDAYEKEGVEHYTADERVKAVQWIEENVANLNLDDNELMELDAARRELLEDAPRTVFDNQGNVLPNASIEELATIETRLEKKRKGAVAMGDERFAKKVHDMIMAAHKARGDRTEAVFLTGFGEVVELPQEFGKLAKLKGPYEHEEEALEAKDKEEVEGRAAPKLAELAEERDKAAFNERGFIRQDVTLAELQKAQAAQRQIIDIIEALAEEGDAKKRRIGNEMDTLEDIEHLISEKQEKVPPPEKKPPGADETPLVRQLVRGFANMLREGRPIPTKPSELRKVASDIADGRDFAQDSAALDDMYDALEGAVLLHYRHKVDARHGFAHQVTQAQEMEDLLAARTRTLEMRKLQQFSTPLTIAEAAAYLADIPANAKVLEPTAGTGNLVEPLVRTTSVLDGEVVAVEKDPRRANVLRELGHNVRQGDFFMQDEKDKYTHVVTNPPWRKVSRGKKPHPYRTPFQQSDIADAFIVKAMNMLEDGGRLVAVLPEHYMGGTPLIQWLSKNHTLWSRIAAPPGAYVSRGTKVGSVVLVAEKGKNPNYDEVAAKTAVIKAVGAQPKNMAEFVTAVQGVYDMMQAAALGEPSAQDPKVTPSDQFTKDKAEKAKELLKKKLNAKPKLPPTQAGFAQGPKIDKEVIRAAVELGGYIAQERIKETGSLSYGDWEEAMVDEVGDVIRPVLLGVWSRIKEVEKSGLSEKMKDKEVVTSDAKGGDLRGEKPTGATGTVGRSPRGRRGSDAKGPGDPEGGELQPGGPDGRLGGVEDGAVSTSDVVAGVEERNPVGVTIRTSIAAKESDADTDGLDEFFAKRKRQDFVEASASGMFSPIADTGRKGRSAHTRQLVEPINLAGVQHPEINERIEDEHLGITYKEQAFAADLAWQGWLNNHGILIADDVGVGKSMEILALIHKALTDPRGAARVIFITKDTQNVTKLLVRESSKMYAGSKKEKEAGMKGQGLLPWKWLEAGKFKAASTRGGKIKLPPNATEEQKKQARKAAKKEWKPYPGDTKILAVTSYNLADHEQAIIDYVQRSPGKVLLIADEAHKFRNMTRGPGGRQPAAMAVALDKIQTEVMKNGQAVYSTATPAEAVGQMLFMKGLREWSTTEGGFADWTMNKATGSELEAAQRRQQREQAARGEEGDQERFREALELEGGEAAAASYAADLSTPEIEQILREWKQKGKYIQRKMWKGGTVYKRVKAELPKEKLALHDRWAELCRDIYTTAMAYARENRRYGSRGLMLIRAGVNNHMKRVQADLRLEPLMDEVEKVLNDPKDAQQAIVHMIEASEKEFDAETTNAGRLMAAIGAINTQSKDDEGAEDTSQYETDPNTGETGIPAALRDKARLLEKMNDMPPLPDVVEAFQKRFGENTVAVVAGKNKGKAWNPANRIKHVQDFQNGKRQIVLVSAAGTEGLDMHHEFNTGPGNKRRHQFFLDYDFSATSFFQRLGRGDRAGQYSSPFVTLVEMPFRAEQKYLTTIANRLRDLGATSHGQSDVATTETLMSSEMDASLGREALHRAWPKMDYSDKLDFIKSTFYEYIQGEGKRPASSTNLTANLKDFTGDLLLMPLDKANRLYDFLFAEYETVLEDYRAQGLELQTMRGTGEILRSRAVKDKPLFMTDVKDAAGHKYAILSGLVTDYNHIVMPLLPDDGKRKFQALDTPDGYIVGRKIPWGSRQRIEKALGLDVQQMKNEDVLDAMRAGEQVLLQKVGALGKQWKLRPYRPKDLGGQVMYVWIDGAGIADEKELASWAKSVGLSVSDMFYAPTSRWRVPEVMIDENGDAVDTDFLLKFLERYPLAKPKAPPNDPLGPTVAGFGQKPKPKRPFGGANAIDPRTWFRNGTPKSSDVEEIKGRMELVEHMWRLLNRSPIIKRKKKGGVWEAWYDYEGQHQYYGGLPRIEALFHDLGHHIQAIVLGGNPRRWGETMRNHVERTARAIKATLPKEEQKELRQRVWGELAALAAEHPHTAGGRLAAEAFAEFTRFYITDPGEALSRAPLLYNHFEKILRDHKELADVVDWGRQEAAVQKQSSDRAKLRSEQTSLTKAPSTTSAKKIALVLDDMYPIKRDIEQALARLDALDQGKKLDPVDDARILADTRHAWVNQTMRQMLKGSFTFGEPGKKAGFSVLEVFEPVAERLQDLDDFLITREYIYTRDERGEDPTEVLGLRPHKNDDPVNGIDYDLLYAEGLADEGVQEAVRRYDWLNDFILRYMVDAGRLSEEAYSRIKENRPIYATMMRAMFPVTHDKKSLGIGTRMLTRLFPAVFRRKGGPWPIVHPTESLIKRVAELHRTIENNEVTRAYAALIKSHPEMSTWATPVEDVKFAPVSTDLEEVLKKLKLKPEDLGVSPEQLEEIVRLWRPAYVPHRDPGIIDWWENGEKHAIKLADMDTFEAFVQMDKESAGLMGRFARASAPLMRTGRGFIIGSPFFWARNLIRDQVTAKIRSQAKYRFRDYPVNWGIALMMTDFGRGIFETVGADQKTYAKWMGLKEEHLEGLLFKGMGFADQSHFFSMDKKQMDQYIARHVRGEKGFFVKDWALSLLEADEALGASIEYATRLQEMRKMGYDTATSRSDMLRAGYAGRKVSVDFGVGGSISRALNQISLFFNPNVQGWWTNYQLFKDPKTRSRAWMRIMPFVVASMLLYGYNRERPEYWKIPIYLRRRYWYVFIPFVEKPIRIMKPHELGLIPTAVESILEFIDTADPETLVSFYKEVMFQLPLEAAIPYVARVPYEIWADRRLYSGAPIEGGLRRTVSAERYRPTTSYLARGIGKVTGPTVGLSPQQVETALTGYFPETGQKILDVMDIGLEATGLVEGKRPKASLRLTEFTDFRTEGIRRFYRKFEKYQQRRKAMRDAENDPAKQASQVRRWGEFMTQGEANDWAGVARRLTELRKEYMLPDTTKARKKELADEADALASEAIGYRVGPLNLPTFTNRNILSDYYRK